MAKTLYTPSGLKIHVKDVNRTTTSMLREVLHVLVSLLELIRCTDHKQLKLNYCTFYKAVRLYTIGGLDYWTHLFT